MPRRANTVDACVTVTSSSTPSAATIRPGEHEPLQVESLHERAREQRVVGGEAGQA